jgi:organic hydroperoxide reductase OsmC/OhrA
MHKTHHYETQLKWTGNRGTGTSDYRAYSRDHEHSAPGKGAIIPGSSDPAFRGDPTRYNPEELLVASLSSCHMLWMLHLCAVAGITVVEYTDQASGTLVETDDGGGELTDVLLRPHLVITDPAKVDEAIALNARAHHLCFIARSVRFPVKHAPTVTVRG